MINIIKMLFLGLFSCFYCVAADVALHSRENGHANPTLKTAVEADKENKMNQPVVKAKVGREHKINQNELTEKWLKKNKINVKGKSYRFEVSDELKKKLPEDEKLQSEFLNSITNIKQKEGINNRVIGFNLKLFNSKIYTESFLGPNAK